jgi:hypothetical protein
MCPSRPMASISGRSCSGRAISVRRRGGITAPVPTVGSAAGSAWMAQSDGRGVWWPGGRQVVVVASSGWTNGHAGGQQPGRVVAMGTARRRRW